MVQADRLHGTNASNRVVCIIDSGLALGHEDLPSESLTGEGQWTSDTVGHGTHVAGIIAALDNADTGIVGVSETATLRLHVVKVVGAPGEWVFASTLAAAAHKCRDAGAHVINMSRGTALGGPDRSRTEADAFEALLEEGVLLVAAAGNSGRDGPGKMFPAGYASVVSVGAVNETGGVAHFSQRNEDVELAGPGVAIESTVPMGTGPAISALTVDGIEVAAVWSLHPECSARELRSSLAKASLDLGDVDRDSSYGFGLVQAAETDARIANLGCGA
ncbi:peptidase S8/S53 domain-containing protein [Pelagophyceae sp. CCMP2097]|nr:peptidase S8/S53 domain-containing protein [Pelagophyceae sp. CCMP2097]